MEIVPLKLSQLAVDKDFNIREARNYGDIDSLAAQIARDGQLNPIQVGKPGEDGKYPVIAGFRRVAAIRKLQRAGEEVAVFAVVVDKEEADRAWINLTENMAREDLTTFERAKGLARMVEDFGWSAKSIAERFGVTEEGERVRGMSASNISNLVNAFQKLSPKALEAWSKGTLAVDGAFALKAKDHEEQDELLPYVKGKTGAALVAAIEEFEQGETPEVTSEDAPKSKRSKPGPATIAKAIAWAKASELDDVVTVLRWVTGKGGKKLKVGGMEFDPKASDTDDGAED